MKKYLNSLLLIFFVIFTFSALSFSAHAWDEVPTPSFQHITETEQDITAYAKTLTGLIPDFDQKTLLISQGYKIQYSSPSTCRAFFVFEGKTCIGQITVAYLEDHFAASYSDGELPVVTKAYQNEKAFSLGRKGISALLLISDGSVEIVQGNRIGWETDQMPDAEEYSQNAPQLIRLSQFSDATKLDETTPSEPKNTASTGSSEDDRAEIMYADFSSSLNVPYVANAISPDNNAGLCWAAATASLRRYYAGGTTTALQVYNTVKSRYYSGANYPTGTRTDMVRSFTCYSLPLTMHDGATNFITVQSKIQSSKPVYCAIRNAALSLGHVVIISGCRISNNIGYYTIVDSNTSIRQQAVVSPAAPVVGFEYTDPNGIVFNKLDYWAA